MISWDVIKRDILHHHFSLLFIPIIFIADLNDADVAVSVVVYVVVSIVAAV